MPSLPVTDNQMEQSVPVEETSTSVAAEAVVPMIQDTFDNQYNVETNGQQPQDELQPHVDSYAGDGMYQNDQFGAVQMTTASSTTKVPKERWHWAYNRVVQVTMTEKIAVRFC